MAKEDRPRLQIQGSIQKPAGSARREARGLATPPLRLRSSRDPVDFSGDRRRGKDGATRSDKGIPFASPNGLVNLSRRSVLHRSGAKNLAPPRQPVRLKVVTHLLGTFRYLCVRVGQKVSWRRGRDSNPRYGCPYAAFRVRCIRPLCHLSKPRCDGRRRVDPVVRRRCNMALRKGARASPHNRSSRTRKPVRRLVAKARCEGFVAKASLRRLGRPRAPSPPSGPRKSHVFRLCQDFRLDFGPVAF
jgi:hypothetical protein